MGLSNISSSPGLGKEEEEDGMSDFIHNFAARKRKRDTSLKQAADAIPKWPGDRISLAWMRVRRCRKLSSQVRLRWV